jgi:hypothetical protein
MTTKKEPSEYIKSAIAIFQVLMASVVVWLFSTVSDLTGQVIELKANQKHIQSDIPRVVEAVEKNTEVIRGLEKIIERLTALLEKSNR